jgi:hypothetical protein
VNTNAYFLVGAYTKGLRDTITSRGNNVIRPEDIDLIRRQVEAKSRDVEY